MLGKFKTGTAWIAPLGLHAAVHAAATFAIAAGMGSRLAMMLGVLDFCAHFIVDRIKASPKLLGRWKPDSPFFWWTLGADQLCHHLTHYLIIYFLAS